MRLPSALSPIRSFRAKLLTGFVLLSLVPLLVLAFVSWRVSYQTIEKNTRMNAEMIIDRVQDEINTLIEESLLVAESIGENSLIQEALRSTFNPEDEQHRLNTQAGEALLNIFEYRKELYGIAVIGENGQSLISTDRNTRQEDFRSRYWYRNVLQNPRPPDYYPPHPGSYVFTEEEARFFTLALPVEDRSSSARIGIVVIEILETQLKEILRLRLQERGYLFIQYGRAGFTSASNETPDSEYLVSLANNRPIDPDTLRNKKEIVLIRDLELKDMQLASVISLEELTRDARRIGLILMLLMMVSLIISILTAILISRSIADPIQKMQILMSQVEDGDLTVRTTVRSHDEIGDLGRSFNRMVERIDALVQNVQEDQIRLRKAELRTLQDQINPHFLYNTLDSINWLCRKGRNEEVIPLVGGLTNLFRIGLSRGKDIIPLREELRHLESYLTIQSIRYENKFIFEADVDETLLDFRVIKLILQPLVENALYHGIKEKPGKGHISLRIRKIRDILLFELEDNGLGMTQERLEQVRKALEDATTGETTGILYGIKNVNDRLKIYYGDSFGLQLHSRSGEGTTIRMKIPAEKNP